MQLQSLMFLLARIFLAALFLRAGWGKIDSYGQTVAVIGGQGVPFAQVAAPLAIFAEIAGGLALLAGYRARLAAVGLIIYVAVVTYYFHDFWRLSGGQAQLQATLFLKNLSIISGLIFLAGAGPGRISIDRS